MTAPKGRNSVSWFLMGLVVLYAMVAASYFTARYAGRWIDSDTAYLTLGTTAVLSEGTLVPARDIYSLGFAYQAISAFIVSVTGLAVPQLQSLAYPLLAAGLSVLAFASYRALIDDVVASAFATLLLFMHPDFIYVIFRGSHEKLTWAATMLAVLLLAKSFASPRNLPRLITYVGLFYLCIYALSASNVFFASSFIITVAVSLAAGLALRWLSKHRLISGQSERIHNRLFQITSAAMVLWFVHTFYLYSPAARILYDLNVATDRAAAVTLGRQPVTDPAVFVIQGWVSRAAYLGLALPSYTASGLAFLVWALLGIKLLRGPGRSENSPLLLLWLLYGGFGTQLALSLLLSLSGGIASNLQLRLFPAVALFGLPLLALGFVRLWRSRSRAWWRRLAAVGLVLVVLWSSAASLLKATNDPWLSNYWQFWTAAETMGISWSESHVRFGRVWLDLQGIRVSAHAASQGFGTGTAHERDTWTIDVETRDILLSRLEEALGLRLRVPVPDVRGELCVYDNGTVSHYHLRPRTPYQR